MPPGLTLDKIEYPVLNHLGDLHETATPYLAHPQGTGFLFRRPSALFEPEPLRRQGLRYSPYPEGFNGSSMQFFSYYVENVGGFTVAALDGRGMMKWLNAWKAEDGRLQASLMHQVPELFSGNGYEVSYPIVLWPDDEGSWYAGADRYKQWAIRQPWAERGTLAERNLETSWLHHDVGYATFGINAAADRSRWLDRFHDLIGLPGFHILGVNWPKRVTGYGQDHPGGYDDWFPARFSTANLAAIETNGDFWAPFTFDLLLAHDSDDAEIIAAEEMRLPERRYSFDAYNFRFCCPATDRGYLPALAKWRDARLVAEYGADALYYDISGNNVLMACRDPEHGHPVGGGEWMVEAFRRMWNGTRGATAAAKGGPVPLGTEMVNEVFLREIDYYQARAEGGLLASFEGEFFRDWVARGEAEKIPLFAYVYHEYGPVRLDGWGKPSRESGDLFYWTAARVALWGGLFELNYEFSPLETLDGIAEDAEEHYHYFQSHSFPIDNAKFQSLAFAIDHDKIDFVRQLGELRTGAGNPYLVFGTMLRPLALDVERIALDWCHFNKPHKEPFVPETGTFEVPAVFHSAWQAPDGSTGLFFANLRPLGSMPVVLDVPLGKLEPRPGVVASVTSTSRGGPATTTERPWEANFTIEIAPRTIALVVIPPGTDVAV